MNATAFAAADAIYECASSSRIQYHAAQSELFQSFWEGSRRLERAAGAAVGEDIVRPLVRATRARFALAAAPLPFCQHAFFRQPLGADSIVERVCRAYPSMAQEAREVADLIRRLAVSDANPLLDRLEQLCQEQGLASEGGAVVVRAGNLREACQSLLETRPELSHWDVVDPQDLRGARTFSRLALIGPTSWFPDYVFGAPRAAELHVITYGSLLRSWRPQSGFVGGPAPERPEALSESRSQLVHEPVEPWPEPDWEEIERRALEESDPSARHGQDVVEARLFLLGQGLAVFLDVSHRSTSLVIDPKADDDARVKRVLSDEIEPGEFLLHRTEGGGDYIVPLANQILGKRAQPSRVMQSEWKRRLRDAVAASQEPDSSSRLMDVSVRLLDLGAQLADETNLRYWMSPRNICTRDRRDFQAILELVGLGSEIERYWTVMRQILAAHHRAGRRIRRSLLELVRELDPSELAGRERIDFSLPEEEGGRLTALRVERRAPERSVISNTREGRIFQREET